MEVTIRERKATAAVRVTDTRWAKIDEDGRVLSVADAAPAGMPDARGVEGRIARGRATAVRGHRRAAGARRRRGRLPRRRHRGRHLARRDPGLRHAVRFGTTGELDAKVAALETVLARVDLGCLAMIDLRAPGSPALTRYGGCS